MSNIDDLANIPPDPPKGFTPGLKFDGEQGFVTTPLSAQEPNHDDVAEIIRLSNLDPDDFIVDWARGARITSHIKDGALAQCWYKLPIYRKPERQFDVEELIDSIYVDSEIYEPNPGGVWRTIMITDQHVGKSESAGGGTDTILKRWQESVSNALKDGEDYAGINLVFGGDMIEGYVSQGGKNIVTCDLVLSEQLRVAQHIVSATIQDCLAHAPEVIVSVVPGNHGETTRVQNMPLDDSFDVMIVRNVKQAFELAGLSERVGFVFPDRSGQVTYKAGDTTFCVAHGHKFRGQLKGAQDWWSGHIANGRPPADASILLAGHFHNFQAANWTADRWILFGPSLETESVWFSSQTGAAARPGVLTFIAREGVPYEIEVV